MLPLLVFAAHRPLLVHRPMAAHLSLHLIGMTYDNMQARDAEIMEAEITLEEHTALKAIGGDLASTYGELTPSGFQTLAKRLRLGPDDVFVDCGSGLGQLVIQAASEYGVRQAIGVEYAQTRHDAALRRLRTRASGAEAARRVRLLRGDCAVEESWAPGGDFSDCTCAYMCNMLFDEALNARLKRCVESCGSIERVAVFKPWPGGLKGFGEPYEVRCETSWAEPLQVFGVEINGGSSRVYVYERRSQALPSWWSGEMEGFLIALVIAFVASAVAGDPTVA